ncbi:hypothetical protein ACOSQ3_031634 [Xanthoceras sorbifolium]
MDMFEKAAYSQQRDQFTSDEIEELMAGVGSFEAIKTIHEHWQQKRQEKGMPLIRHLQGGNGLLVLDDLHFSGLIVIVLSGQTNKRGGIAGVDRSSPNPDSQNSHLHLGVNVEKMAVSISASSEIKAIVVEIHITDDVNQGIDGMHHNEPITEMVVGLKKDSFDRDSLSGITEKGIREDIEISILKAVSMHDNKTPI